MPHPACGSPLRVFVPASPPCRRRSCRISSVNRLKDDKGSLLHCYRSLALQTGYRLTNTARKDDALDFEARLCYADDWGNYIKTPEGESPRSWHPPEAELSKMDGAWQHLSKSKASRLGYFPGPPQVHEGHTRHEQIANKRHSLCAAASACHGRNPERQRK